MLNPVLDILTHCLVWISVLKRKKKCWIRSVHIYGNQASQKEVLCLLVNQPNIDFLPSLCLTLKLILSFSSKKDCHIFDYFQIFYIFLFVVLGRFDFLLLFVYFYLYWPILFPKGLLFLLPCFCLLPFSFFYSPSSDLWFIVYTGFFFSY